MKRLTLNQYILLCEALRRYTRFHEDEPLNEAWTGLGSMSKYKPCLTANLMTYATSPNPGHMTWWKLTNAGAKIVQQWIEEGFDFEKIEANNLPDCRKKYSL